MRTAARKFTTITTALALAIGATFTLSGCFGNPLDDLARGGASEFLKGATGADIDIGGTSIPQNFPSQIPVADGEVEFGGSIAVEGKRVWTVRIKSKDSAVFSKLQSTLRASGFEESFATEGESAMGAFEGHGYGLVVNVDKRDGAYGVTYVVSELGDDDA